MPTHFFILRPKSTFEAKWGQFRVGSVEAEQFRWEPIVLQTNRNLKHKWASIYVWF